MKNLLLILTLFISYVSFGQTVPMTNNVPWYEFSKKLSVGKFMLKSSGEYDTSFTIPSNTASITLDTIAADKTVTFADGSAYDKGVTMYVQNANSSAFVWNVAGNVKEADGTVITNLPRGLHIFYWNSNAWIRLSTSGGSSPTVDTLTFSTPLVQLDKNVSLDFDAFPQDTIGVVEHNDSLFNILYSHTGVRDSTFIVLLTSGGGGLWDGTMASSTILYSSFAATAPYSITYYYKGASIADFTMPSLSGIGFATAFLFKNESAYVWTIEPDGSDDMYDNGLIANFDLDPGESAWVISDEGSSWHVYLMGGGGSGNTNSNIGSGFRWAVPNTNNIKTKFDGWGITTDSATNTNGLTSKVDSATVLAAARNSLAAVARTGDYGSLSNTPSTNPGVYFSPATAFNNEFIVFASGIVRPTASYSSGVAITWEFLDNTSGHNSSFFTYVRGNSSSKRLIIGYPKVKYVLNATVTPDESFAAGLVVPGPTVGFDSMQIQVNRNRQIGGVRLTGAGTSTWTKSGTDNANWSIDTHSGGGTSFTLTQAAGSVWGVSYEGINAEYVGSNPYHLRRVFSGLGSFNARFTIYDSTNTIVTSNPTSSDIILLGGTTGNTTQAVPMDVYLANVNDFMSTTTNFWVFAVFEAYMTARGISTSSVRVAWQNYTAATGYKIYRATDAAFTSPTLIYSGTANSYVDTGLSSATIYHYKMVATIASVDTDITTFRAITY